MECTERTTPSGLRTEITDNARAGGFEASIDGHLVGWQPYRRYGSHFVLMRTEVDEQWRTQGISSAMIDGILGMIGVTGQRSSRAARLRVTTSTAIPSTWIW
jgi:hypothetical protein